MLLTALLLHANQVVSRERLLDELWIGEPPETAPKMIQNAVSQLRKLLRTDPPAQPVLVTLGRGYLLRVEPGQLDADLFERLVAEARDALEHDAPDGAAQKLREALSLWRGPALADFVDEPFARSEIARLEELRLTAIEDRIEADLALGRHGELVAELEGLAAEHPLRERLRGQLMLALYRSGRQAEALDVYQKTRQLLVGELGIEPGPALQRLERAVLLQDPALELPVERRPAAVDAEAVAVAAPREVRKTVTVLFADVVSLGEPLDPEALRGLMERALDAVTGALELHGASVDRLPSGEVMAVFGVPRVHEDDALRAVRAALEARDALRRLNEELEEGWGAPVAVRAAVNTGEVLVGESGIAAAVAGGAVKLVHHLAQLARPGEILIGEGTERVVRLAVRAEPVAPVSVAPGTEERAWRLIDVIAGAPAIPSRVDAPMVARKRELAQLRQAFDRAVREQTSYLFTILGPAGIGKSRLASEFASSVADEAMVLTGRCLSYGEGITFWPLAEVVAEAAGESTRTAIAKLLSGQEDAELIADRVAGAIGVGEAGGGAEETFWAVRKLFEALARAQPLVLVFEDLHWAEPTFLDLIEYVAEWTRDAAVLAVCVARPELLEERPSWGGGKLNATSILLEPLSEREGEALIDSLLGEAGLGREARGRILEAAEGNPLFLEHMLAMVGEGEGGTAELAVPPTIQSLLAARLDGLALSERVVLERASVVGREFWQGAVVALSPAEEVSVGPLLQSLVRRDLIRPCRSVFPGEEAFRVRHTLMRETAYDSVPKQERSDLHERFAAWLEDVAGDRIREYEEILGYHLEQAYRHRAELGPVGAEGRELAQRAARRLAAAGRRAYARSDMHAAVGLLSRAAALLEEDMPGRLELLVDLGEALRETGEFERSLAILAEVIGRASAEGNRALDAHATVGVARVRLQTDLEITSAELVQQARRAVQVFEELGDEGGLAKAWELIAWAPWFRCQAAAAAEPLQHALEHAKRAGDARTEEKSLHLLVGAAFFGPMAVAEGIRLCEEILARSGERQSSRASALRALAGLKAMEGSFDEARALIARQKAILQDVGLRVTAAWASETAGIVEMLAGDPVAAEQELRRGYESLEGMGETGFMTLAAQLAQALYMQGRHEEALRFTEISEEDAAQDALSSQIQWRAARAKVLARLGEGDEPESLARRAVALAEQTDFLVLHGDALMDLGEVLSAGERHAEAIEAVEQALELYERKGSAVSAGRARSVLAGLRAATANTSAG